MSRGSFLFSNPTIGRLAAIFPLLATSAWGGSPWLPSSGRSSVTLTYVNESFQQYWLGKVRRTLPAPIDQHTGYVQFEYGLHNRLALDVVTGYTATDYSSGEPIAGGAKGIADSVVGLRWAAYNGDRTVLTFRGAAIQKGTYDLTTTSRFSPGDKVNGAQGSVLLGTILGRGAYFYGEGGYRYRATPVPNVFFGTAGVGHRYRGVSYGLAYQHNQALNGMDIGQPGFGGFRQLRETKQVQQVVDLNVGYTLKNGIYFGFDFAHNMHGRNTGNKRILAFSLGFSIPKRGPHF